MFWILALALFGQVIEIKAPEYRIVRIPAPQTADAANLWDVSEAGGKDVYIDIDDSSAGEFRFVAPPGNYRASCYSVTIVNGKPAGKIYRYRVTIGGDGPQPLPPAPPSPTGWTKVIGEAAAKIDAPNKGALCHSLAANFRAVAASAVAGAFNRNPDGSARDAKAVRIAIQKQTRENNRQTLAADNQKWTPVFQAIEAEILKAPPSSVDDVAALWKAIADGFDGAGDKIKGY